jgi:hypothetical protein
MRRSSIGLPLRPSNSPPDFGGDVPFDDDDGVLDEGGDLEEPESPSGPSKQPQTPRRAGTSNGLQNGEDSSRPRPRSKSKTNARQEDQDGEDVEEEIAQGLQDAEMQQEDEDEEVTPKKKLTEKRPRKKRVLAEIPRKKPLCYATTIMLISSQYLQKIHLGSEEANGYVTSHLNGGDAKKLSTEDVIQARKPTFQQSKKLFVSRKMNPSHWVLLHTRPNAPPPIAERQPKNQEQTIIRKKGGMRKPLPMALSSTGLRAMRYPDVR